MAFAHSFKIDEILIHIRVTLFLSAFLIGKSNCESASLFMDVLLRTFYFKASGSPTLIFISPNHVKIDSYLLMTAELLSEELLVKLVSVVSSELVYNV